MPFHSPNFTQIPNDLLGDQAHPGLMATLGYAELKVLMAVCRLTFGYHRKMVRASVTTITRMTGLSRPSVIDAASMLETAGMIFRDTSQGVGCWHVLTDEVEDSQAALPDDDIEAEPSKAALPPEPSASKAALPPSMKENSKRKEKPCATSSRAPTPPAVSVFRSETNRLPTKSWWPEISRTVGEKPEDLERWRAVCHAYVGLGWSQVNVKAMLEFYGRNEIPGSNWRYKAKPTSNRPASFDAIEEYARHLQEQSDAGQ